MLRKRLQLAQHGLTGLAVSISTSQLHSVQCQYSHAVLDHSRMDWQNRGRIRAEAAAVVSATLRPRGACTSTTSNKKNRQYNDWLT